jgi:helix-turn-helix protein
MYARAHANTQQLFCRSTLLPHTGRADAADTDAAAVAPSMRTIVCAPPAFGRGGSCTNHLIQGKTSILLTCICLAPGRGQASGWNGDSNLLVRVPVHCRSRRGESAKSPEDLLLEAQRSSPIMPRTTSIEAVIASNVERLCRRRGMSPKTLATNAGVALADLTPILHGEGPVSIGIVERLATALCVSEAELVRRPMKLKSPVRAAPSRARRKPPRRSPPRKEGNNR